MIVGVPGDPDDARVALVPPVAERLVDRGVDVLVASGAGADAGWDDAEYAAVGCDVAAVRDDVFERADVIFHVRGLGARRETTAERYRDGQVVVGLLGPYDVDDGTLAALAARNVSAFALELLPRISRAQGMDVLTSMASVGGYKAVVVAAEALPKLFPMQMTAAGTVRPADVFVVGAGVAGLQAVATARRLGARVRAYDVRPAVREEVESLGADFLDLDLETADAATERGYARERDAAFYRAQREAMTGAVGDADVVVTTAAVPGRPAPTLVTAAMVEGMDAGSVVVDLAAGSGGNCEVTRPGETVVHDDVTVVGATDLPATVSRTASQLLASNLVSFLDHLRDVGRLEVDAASGTVDVDTGDEIVDATLLTHGGTVRHPRRGETTRAE